MRLLVSTFLCATACGRFGFEETPSTATDAATDGVFEGDCWALWRSGAPRFSRPAPITELALADKQGNPWLAYDAKSLYFDSGTGDTEVFRAIRGGRGMPFGPPDQLTALTSPNEETSLVISEDNTLAVLSSTRPGSMGFDLYQTQRASADAQFGALDATPLGNVTSANNEFDAFLTADGLRLYYAQSSAPGQVLLATSRQTRADVFGIPAPLMGSGTFDVEADPDLSPDELVLAFSARLADGGPLQLVAAVRAETDQGFGTPFELTDLAGPGHDGDPAFSPDGCELFWISDRGGDRDLYHANVMP